VYSKFERSGGFGAPEVLVAIDSGRCHHPKQTLRSLARPEASHCETSEVKIAFIIAQKEIM